MTCLCDMTSLFDANAASAAVRLCVFAAFAVAALSKFATPLQTGHALREFGVPAQWAGVCSGVLAVTELTVATGLALPWTVRIAAAAALALLGAFTTVIGVNLLLGNRPRCACFGGFRPVPIGVGTVLRNLMLVAATVFVLASAPQHGFGHSSLGLVDLADGSLIFPASLAVLFALVGLTLIQRFRENSSAFSLATEPSAQNRPLLRSARSSGLAMGSVAPDFELPLLSGGVANSKCLVRGQQSAVLVFASPTCGQCAAVLPAVAKLQDQAGERLKVLVISSGDATLSRRMLSDCAIKMVAVDASGRLARLFRISGAPSAVLIGPDGTIAREAVGGAQAVMNLLAQLATTLARPAAEHRGSSGEKISASMFAAQREPAI